MKLSNSMRNAGLALGLTAAAGCNNGEAEKAYGELQADKQETVETSQPTQTAAPTAAPVVPAQAPAPTQAPAPAVQALETGDALTITEPKAKAAFKALCERYETGRLKPYIREGVMVYSICAGSADRIFKVLNRCEDTKAASHLEKSFCFEDKAGQTHYGFQYADLLNQEGTGPLVMTTSVGKNVQDTAESNEFWKHLSWDEQTGDTIPGLPFSRNAEFMFAYPTEGNITVSVQPKPGKPTTPKQPGKPSSASTSGLEGLNGLRAEVSELGRRVDGLEDKVDKNTKALENFTVKPATDIESFIDQD